MIKNFREEIIKATRLDDIMAILSGIIVTQDKKLPVRPYVSNNSVVTHIDGIKLREEASILLSMLSIDDISRGKFMDDLPEDIQDHPIVKSGFDTLRKYITSHTEDLLHNYGVSAAHRNQHNSVDIDKVRCYLILENLLACWNLVDDYDDRTEWSIPSGWKYKSPEHG